MKRVVVVGSGGSGKSTFSRELGKATGLPVVHLDALYWKPNWTPTPADQWAEVVRLETEKREWIMDGNFGGTREMRMNAADTIIVLDLPRWLCIYRIFKRWATYHNKKRPDMADGCNEKIDWDFVTWVWNYRSNSRVRLLKELESHPNKTVVILKSQHEATEFLERMRLQYR
jgi:adenylate kinase family enzyme